MAASSDNPRNRRGLFGAVMVVFALIAVACGGGGNTETANSEDSDSADTASANSESDASSPEASGDALPSMAFELFDGGETTIAEFGDGKPIVLNFWASWCDPCRAEAPVLERGWRRARERRVLFVGLNMQDIRADARDFVDEFRLDFPHVRDPSRDTARTWGVTGIPETFFIAADGGVVGHVIGTVSADQLEQGVEAAASGKPAGALQGGAQLAPR